MFKNIFNASKKLTYEGKALLLLVMSIFWINVPELQDNLYYFSIKLDTATTLKWYINGKI